MASIDQLEPNPRSFRSIEENVGLNALHNVAAHRLALGADAGTRSLTYPAGEPGRGTLSGDAAAELRRQHGSTIRTATIPIDTLDHFVATHEQPDPAFVKIDVEGFECDVLEGMAATMARCRPDLFVELYGVTEADKVRCTRCVLAFVRPFGYSVIHVESGRPVADSASFMPLTGHLYATPSADRADAAARVLTPILPS